ncbi:MAG: KH domain-containing protein [Clostridia bacterium]|nr:KH domain-containing protein [Clostridia bacterium]
MNEVKELLSYIVSNLVEFPDQVTITETEEGDTIVYKLKTAQSDMGKIIGRQGKIAKEIRVLAKALGQRNGKRIQVDIVD